MEDGRAVFEFERREDIVAAGLIKEVVVEDDGAKTIMTSTGFFYLLFLLLKDLTKRRYCNRTGRDGWQAGEGAWVQW